MMYINFDVVDKYNLSNDEVVCLFALKQLNTERLTDSTYKLLSDKGFISHIKNKSKLEHLHSSARLSDLGKDVLKKLQEPPIDPQDETVMSWLSKFYLNEGKIIGNKKKTLRHVRDFRVSTGIQKNNLIKLCVAFLNKNSDRSHKLEYVFFRAENAFQTRFNKDQSWLYSFYLENKTYFDSVFEEY